MTDTTLPMSDLVLLHFVWDEQYVRRAASLVLPGGYLSLAAHSAQNYLCFAHPKPARIYDESMLPSGFEIVHQEARWQSDRHCIHILLHRNP
jgi:hypothetical protein